VVSKNLVLGRGTDPDYLTGKAILWGLNTKVDVIAKVGVQRRCIPLPNYFRHLFKKKNSDVLAQKIDAQCICQPNNYCLSVSCCVFSRRQR